MKIITCASYYATGSSAVTDYLGEFECVHSLGETEFRFLQDPDGITNLETNIIDHPHRHNTSQAIKRYNKLCKFENGDFISKRYRRYFDDKFMEYTYEYIGNITSLISNNVWRYDKVERGRLFYYVDTIISMLNNKISRHNKFYSILAPLGEKAYYSDINRDDFYKETQLYTSKLFKVANPDKEYIMVDQLVPPNDIGRFFNYVNNLYVIVVNRDPRDIYIRENALNPGLRVIPQKSVEDFCKWYRITRNYSSKDKEDPRILFINFEDLVHKYEETTKMIRDYIGLDYEPEHKCTRFIPSESATRTKEWEKHPEYENDIKYIKEHLPEFIYQY